MASNTPNFGLRKPANTDVVNVATDIAANMDLIDTALALEISDRQVADSALSLATKFAVADAVMYVSKAATASDSNDGLSPRTAKATIAAAYAAGPSTGVHIKMLAGSHALPNVAVGLTVSPTKPLVLDGIGMGIAKVTYAHNTGIAILADGTGTDPNDLFWFRDFTLQMTGFGSHTGIKMVYVHRNHIDRVYVLGNSYGAGSRGVWGDNAFGNYIADGVVAGFATTIDLDGICHDFSIDNVNLGAAAVCVRIKDSTDVRIRGGQHSGTAPFPPGSGGTTIGHMLIATAAAGNGCLGYEQLEVHFEGLAKDVVIGRAADGSNTAILNPTIEGPFPNGFTIDQCNHPMILNAALGQGVGTPTFTLTSSCSYPLMVGTRTALGATLTDSSGTPTVLNDTNGRTGFGTLAPDGLVHVATGQLLLNNNIPIRWKDAAGTSRRMLLLSGSNTVFVGDVDNAIATSTLSLHAGGTGTINGTVNGVEKFRANTTGLIVGTNDTTSLGALTAYGSASGKTAVFRANATTPDSLLELQNSAGTAKVAVDAEGRVGIITGGVSAPHMLFVQGTHPGTATSLVGIGGDMTAPATATSSATGLLGRVRTAAASFTLAGGQSFDAAAPIVGAASAITTQNGMIVRNQGASGITNAHGIRVLAQSGAATENYGVLVGSCTQGALWLGYDANNTDVTGGLIFGADKSAQIYRSAGSQMTLLGKAVTTATSATRAGFNLPHGTVPTTPADGDLWTTSAGLFVRINGATVGPLT